MERLDAHAHSHSHYNSIGPQPSPRLDDTAPPLQTHALKHKHHRPDPYAPGRGVLGPIPRASEQPTIAKSSQGDKVSRRGSSEGKE